MGRTPLCTEGDRLGSYAVVIGILDLMKVAGNGIRNCRPRTLQSMLRTPKSLRAASSLYSPPQTARPFVPRIAATSMVTPPPKMAPRSDGEAPVVMRIDFEQKVMPSSSEPERFVPITRHSLFAMSKDATPFESCSAQRPKKQRSTLVLNGVRRSRIFSMNSEHEDACKC